MKQIFGHTSPETAYVVDDYPYGFRLRTKIRYWVETKKNFGQRFVSQTLNPKTDKWNKPKTGNYHQVAILGLSEKPETLGHVTFAALSNYDEADTIEAFAKLYKLDEYQSEWTSGAVSVKNAYANKLDELQKAGKSCNYGDVVKACIEDDIESIKQGKSVL